MVVLVLRARSRNSERRVIQMGWDAEDRFAQR